MKYVFTIGITAACLLVGYFLYTTYSHNEVTSQSIQTPVADISEPTRTVPPGMKEYNNAQYQFSFFYPETLRVEEFDEGGGAATITFQNSTEGKGFQVFIAPYGEPQVSEERFKKDLPSGVRLGLSDMSIDGVTAAAFYSKNAILGETREVWFIHNGFLYEVTTLKSFEVWLSDILDTWQFL